MAPESNLKRWEVVLEFETLTDGDAKKLFDDLVARVKQEAFSPKVIYQQGRLSRTN